MVILVARVSKNGVWHPITATPETLATRIAEIAAWPDAIRLV